MEGCWSYETSEKKSSLKGKISKLQVLLKAQMDPNKIAHLNICCKDSTTLHNTNEYKEAKELLKSGADVNKKNSWGETPLHIALQQDKGYHFVKLLLEHGADVNAISGLGRKPLHYILKHGRYADQKIINLLLHYGADIDMNSQAFFSKSIYHSISNERWFDKGDIALTKSLIKITLLFGYSDNYCKTIVSIFCDGHSYCDEIGQFTKKCIEEISELMVENVSDELSLFDIAISEPEELKLVPLKIKKYYPTKFPVYWDIIKSRCKSYMRRVVLFKALESAQMVIVSETSNKEIFVDQYCLSMICENLVNNDLENFIKALLDEQTLNQIIEWINKDL